MSNFCGQDIVNCIEQMKYTLLRYSFSNSVKISVSLELISADPGEGRMIDALLIKASNEPDETGRQKSVVAEVFPFNENQPPRISVTDTYVISIKY